MKEITLPSGVELKITPATFTDANNLYKAIASEAKGFDVGLGSDIDSKLIKDIICTLVSSEKIEAALWKCFKRCTYGGLNIDLETFESTEAREDYFVICKEVLSENIAPFLKSLFVEFVALQRVLEIKKSQK